MVGTGPLESILKDYKVIRWISSQVTKQDNVRGKERGDTKTEPANRDTKLKTKTVYVCMCMCGGEIRWSSHQ